MSFPANAFDEIWLACIRDGRIARKVGLPFHRCPPFRIKEMADGWKIGWQQMDSAMSKKHEDLTAGDRVVLGLAWHR